MITLVDPAARAPKPVNALGDGVPADRSARALSASPDVQRARWVADLSIALCARMTDSMRLDFLNTYYDLARNDGVQEGIDRLAARLRVKP